MAQRFAVAEEGEELEEAIQECFSKNNYLNGRTPIYCYAKNDEATCVVSNKPISKLDGDKVLREYWKQFSDEGDE